MATPAPIAREQARILYRNAPIAVLLAGSAACLVATVFVVTGRVALPVAGVWMAMMIGCVAFHLRLCAAFDRATDPDPERWIWRFTFAAGLEGFTWCWAPIVLTDGGEHDQVLIVALLSTAMASGAAYVFSTDLRPFRAFFYPVMVPYIVVFLISTHPLHLLVEAMVWIYLFGMPVIAASANRQLIETLRLRFENEALAGDLRQQKTVADEANIAKSRFLASASHDLRQPIHALGLFIGALRPRRMDREARRLVDLIAGSVDAMDDLFAALLDISKLDAGAVRPEFQPVGIGPMLARIARDHAYEATAKGIDLRMMTCSLSVRSDPALLERALRNIIANAVRHTDRGRVLVGVRRGGMRLEVHDTGPGIALAERTRIFDEFYQIGNPERDRTKGLGLGLAIVRRISTLIDAPLTLTTQPGRGSCFALRLHAVDPAPPPALAPVAPIADPGGALILVIDDEAGIREAMSSLLTSWGYRVIVAGTLAEMLDRVAERPDLIVCDYRLRDDEDGITAIERLHAHFGAAIPAMLITGDTAPHRISGAQASGYLLLHKPVPSGRLRAAIANLIRAAQNAAR